MKKLFAVLFLTMTVAALSFAQDRGLSVVAKDNLGQSANIGKQYALFIAIDAYRTWPALKKPVADAREIRDILKRDYYVDEVIELYNQQATRANITRTFTELQTKLNVHDSLFIYYAGHGHYDSNSDAGFWIPVDGGTDDFAQENWLPNSQIRGYVSRLKTIHVFIVSDACFSGDILNTNRSLPPQIDNAYFRKAYTLTSRQVLTSGSSETVPDKSEFSSALINCLQKNTAPLLDPLGIYNDVRLAVKETTPLYGTLTAANHQDGATFLFFRRQSSITEPTPAPAPLEPDPVNYMKDTMEAFNEIAWGTVLRSVGPADIVDRIRDIIETEKSRTMDIVICLDTTASMKDDIEALCKNFASMLGRNMRGTSYRVGLVLFKDYYEEYLTKVVPFTANLTQIQHTLNGIIARGGRDIPEAVHEALYDAAVKFSWEAETRLIILIGDAPPHLRQRGEISLEMVRNAAAERGIRIHPIIASGG